MPGHVVTQGSTVTCAHQGQASPTTANPRVRVAGQAVVAVTTTYTIAGCPLPPNAGGPCVTGMWTSGSVRVLAGGQPLAIQAAPGTCVPTGVPMSVLVTQPRVRAT